VKKALILTAGFGEGHNAAARNLRDALLAENPDARVEMRDVFLEAYGWLNQLSVRGYLMLINRLPGVWNLVFQWLDRSSAVSDQIGIFGRAARQLNALLDEMEPDVVVSTYPGYNHLLDHLHNEAEDRAFTQVTIVTDSLTINRVWHTGHSDWYVVANEATAEVMRAQGVPAEKVRVLGFPVPAFFAEPREKLPATAGEPWRVLFMVNSGKRIAVEAVRELLALEGIALSVTVGRDEALEARIRALGGKSEVYGWTKELPRLMAEAHVVVSKAGGATVQECLAACTPMIVSQVVPGQEEGNARLIAESAAGVIAETPEAIAAAVRTAFANGGEIWKGWHAATRALSRPHAARDVARWIETL
jgi:processive 1,2-diacylglycerol beta-glucosyltransferase